MNHVRKRLSARLGGGVMGIALLMSPVPAALGQTPGPPPVPLGSPLSRDLGAPGVPALAPGFSPAQPKAPNLSRPAPGGRAGRAGRHRSADPGARDPRDRQHRIQH